jgi:hypothetical protein
MAVSLIVVFLYGSMVWGVLPLEPGVSWESHLFGGLVGILMAWWYRAVPPAHVPPPPIYVEEPEDDRDAWSGGDPGDEQPARPRDRPELPTDPMYDPSRTSSTWPWEQ